MISKRFILLAGLFLFLVIAGLGMFWFLINQEYATTGTSELAALDEYIVRELPLDGPASHRDAELSGLTWYKDHLILLPQYPERLSSSNSGAIYAIPKSIITAFINGELEQDALLPMEIPIVSDHFADSIPGYQGYEAIAFDQDRAYLAIEAGHGQEMMGYLISGEMKPDLSALYLDSTTLQENPPQLQRDNKSDESLLIINGKLISIYEVYGLSINPDPISHEFDSKLTPISAIPFPNIEYRITDATMPDAQGHFWVINYYFPRDVDLQPNIDPLRIQYGAGKTHQENQTVERLVELSFNADGIQLLDKAPIQLSLLTDGTARNWEGIARLDNYGFLLVTDKFPRTILGFVKYP